MPSLPLDVFCFSTSVQHPGRECKGEKFLLQPRNPSADGRLALQKNTSVLLALRDGSARQADLGEHRRIVAERLVHVRNDLHDLAEQGAFAVIHDFGHEIGSDRLPVGVELDLAVGGIDLDFCQRFLVAWPGCC